jgi:hypothetical protein
MATFSDIRTATLNARARTGVKKLGTEVCAGRLRLTVICQEGRRVASIPASAWLSADGAIDALNALQTESDVSDAMARAAIARI